MSRVKLGDVAREYKATVKDASGLPIVGLEHLTPGEITLDRWDEGTENTFTKEFKKGQVLFGRRRAYLKKAALAPFDGVCSGDITVIEAIPGKILPDLLPFIIQNDLLFDYAVGKSAGSLSPRVKWIDLKDYEFELPEIGKQAPMVELLQAAHAARKAYKELIQATDDLVKSQFIEMFGTIDCEGVLPRVQWKNVLTIINGKDYKAVAQDDGEYPVYGTGGIMARASQYLCPENSVLMGRKGTIDNPLLIREKFWNVDTAFGVVPEPDKLNCVYLYWYCKQLDFTKLNKATTLPSTTKVDLLNLWINVPEMEEQLRFAEFAEQSDKSKFELQEAIIRIDNLIKSLIQQDSE